MVQVNGPDGSSKHHANYETTCTEQPHRGLVPALCCGVYGGGFWMTTALSRAAASSRPNSTTASKCAPRPAPRRGRKANPNLWRATWKGKGHVPVAAYHGFRTNNLVVEVTFRFGENTEPWDHQCFGIAADQWLAITGHVVSAWANTDNEFIELGFLLQHIRKTPEKTIIEDLLLDRQSLTLKPHIDDLRFWAILVEAAFTPRSP